MKQIIKLFTLLALTSMVLLAACGPTPPETEETRAVGDSGETTTSDKPAPPEEGEEVAYEIALFVGSELAECAGAGPQTCMMVKNSSEEEYTYFYDQIQGFEYEEGYEYELRVLVTPVENPPADGSSMKYFLLEVVEKTAVNQTETTSLEGMLWQVDNYAVNGEMVKTLPGTMFAFAGGQMVGMTGCNNTGAGYTTDGNAITFEMGMSTMMSCGSELDAQEQAIQANVAIATSYQIEGDTMKMMDTKGNVILQFSVLQSVTLTDTLWQATGINNGTGGVTSLLAETVVTAVFGTDGTLSGNASCNLYNTTYEAGDGTLNIDPSIITTRRACTEPIAAQEGQYLTAIANATTYTIVGDKLELRDADGSLQASYVAVPATPLVGTTWEAISYGSGGQVSVGVMGGSRITAVFNEDNTLNGNAGCNYAGNYTMSGTNGIAISGIDSSLAACGGMAEDMAYLAAMQTAVSYTINDNKLELYTTDGALAVAYVAAEPAPLANSEWDVTFHNNGKGGVTSSIIGTKMTMSFDAEGGVSGTAGCNNYFGGYEAGSELLTFGPIASTEMFCVEPEGIMEQETEFLAALATVNSYHIDGGMMTMRSENGETAVQLQRSTSVMEPGVGMANPASVYCEENGGTLEIRTDADGGQFGMCVFDDGSECEEWAFFNGTCSPTE